LEKLGAKHAIFGKAWKKVWRAFIPPLLLAPWIVEERSDEATQEQRRATDAAALGERGYSFTQAPFAFEDFTAASTKARPFTPSSMVGKCTPSGGFDPERAALIASATSL
jgi:hypothetical protein